MKFHCLPESHEWWAQVSAGLALPWPHAAALADCQWFASLLEHPDKGWLWMDDVKCFGKREMPTVAALARRWGWSRCRVAALLEKQRRGRSNKAISDLAAASLWIPMVEGLQ